MNFFRVFLIFLFFSTLLSSARIFTNSKGKKINASIVETSEEKVKLKLARNQKTYWIEIATLSEKDQEYIKQWADKSEGTEESATESNEDATADKKYNFDEPWPGTASVDGNVTIEIVKEDKEKKRFVYQSPNYKFICDVKLGKDIIKKFAVLFEATREYCRLLPISTMKAHIPSGDFHYKILLFEKDDSYIKNGGPPGSAGVFIPQRDNGRGVVMVPLSSLGVKKVGGGFMYDYKGSNKTLPHEIAHQLTDSEYYSLGSRGWFSEGLAEYIAVTPYRSGNFIVKGNLSAVKAYATDYGRKGKGGRALGEKISAPNLEEYMLQSYKDFVADANFNYGLGLLITYYFFHMEEDRSNINAFLKALKQGKKGTEALEVLRNGRSWTELEKQISSAWRSRGVQISFKRKSSRTSTK